MGLIVNALPEYSGPYPVATADLELAVANPRSFGHALLKSTTRPALQLDTVLVTLFYPADSTQRGSGNRQHWLQRPLGQTAEGYARFLGQKPWLVKALFWLVGARVRLPVQADRSLAPKKTDTTSEGASTASSQATAVDAGLAGEKGRFPLVVFSHGLSGTRTTYSQWCGEIASKGYIVAAIEHRDGSGPVSVVRLGEGKERVVDYIRPEHLEWPAGHPPQSAMQFRSSQLSMRLAEISSVLSLVQRLNNGEGAAVAKENRRKEYGEGKSLEGWKGRIDMEKEITMAGHSFGGSTTIQVLRAGATQYPFKRGIALDPWADPIPPAPAPSSPTFSPLSASVSTTTTGSNPAPTTSPSNGNGNGNEVPLDINVPFLAINSEAFTLWRQHYSLVKDIVKAVGGGADRWLMTLIGSIHISFSDLPLLLPSYLNPRAGSRVPARLATSRLVQACSEFLAGQGTSGEILGQQVKEGDEDGARDGEGGKDEEGKKRVMQGEVGSMRMHIAGRA